MPLNGKYIDLANLLTTMSERKTFLMVSTVEPRKQYVQILETFELPQKNDKDINFVIISKQEWMVEQFLKRPSNYEE